MTLAKKFVTVYRKFAVAAGGFVAVVAASVEDGTITTTEWLAMGAALAAALGVRQVTNKPAGGAA